MSVQWRPFALAQAAPESAHVYVSELHHAYVCVCVCDYTRVCQPHLQLCRTERHAGCVDMRLHDISKAANPKLLESEKL